MSLGSSSGTLTARSPSALECAMLEVLDEHEPEHGIASGSFRSFFGEGFPWQTPHLAHPELCTTEKWWERVEPIFARGYVGVGFSEARATTLARLARERYVDVRHWRRFPDTVPVLSNLRERGWRHLLLSNHVPELGVIVTHLGLDGFARGNSEFRANRLREASPRSLRVGTSRRRRSRNRDSGHDLNLRRL